MDILRTPADRFDHLVDFPWDSRYVTVDDTEGGTLRIALLDEGPREADPVLLLHGEPSWSYLYRHMIPPLVAAGHRVLAPDLIGFGRSDKPTRVEDHTYARHVTWFGDALLGALGLDRITLFCQDWGGLIGLRLVAEHADRFARVVVANTGLPTGAQQMPEAFLAWQRHSQTVDHFPVGDFVQAATVRELTPEEVAAYDAPFPDETYKAGPRAMPALVPTSVDDPAHRDQVEAWESLQEFDRPFLTAFSDVDLITAGGDRVFHELVPGAAGQPHTTVEGAGHFLQEDAGEELARIIDGLVRATPLD